MFRFSMPASAPRLTAFLMPALLAMTPAAQAQTARPVPGGIADILLPASSTRPEARLGDKPVLVRQEPDGWHAWVGIPLDTPPGRLELQLGKGPEARTLPFEVQPHSYPVQRLSIKNPRLVTPNPEDELRILADGAVLREARETFDPRREARLPLALPAQGRLSSRFGLQRFFNGQPRAPHSGLDVAVPSGTPVRAPADGVVNQVGDYYFNGLTVFVDHGQGLVSMVCHLSRSRVRPGDTVRQGDVLGDSGQSGRATGPHLHWSMYLNGTAVDPQLLLSSGPGPAR